jgi:hypothetical protein
LEGDGAKQRLRKSTDRGEMARQASKACCGGHKLFFLLFSFLRGVLLKFSLSVGILLVYILSSFVVGQKNIWQ